MTKELNILADIRRPRILVRTARIAGQHYHREAALRKIFGALRPKHQEGVVLALLQRETELEELRQHADASYKAQTHVHVLATLIIENRRL